MTNLAILRFIFTLSFVMYIQLLQGQEKNITQIPTVINGEINDKVFECRIHEFEDEIGAYLKESRDKLVKKGILPPKHELLNKQMIVTLEWPLRQAEGFDQFSYYTVTNFVDQNPVNSILDYECGNRTYDGHNGIDISLWPFWWKMMAEDQVEVIAAAPGIIIAKPDGNFDMNCSCTGDWNAVCIEHSDGSYAWYGHLKSGSVLSKPIGASVSTGELLGFVGSSGCSSNPHLHFEVREADDSVIEPYVGACNSTTSTSWWANQKPYWEPTLNHLQTHTATPIIGGFCPGTEAPLFEKNFEPGDVIWCSFSYHDEQEGQTTTFSIVNSIGATIEAWTRNAPSTESRSWGYTSFTLPNFAFEGVYSFNAMYQGETKSHYFVVGCGYDISVTDQTVYSDVIYKAMNTITTTGNVIVNSGPGTPKFSAGNQITLSPGFVAGSGNKFEAVLDGCQ